MTKLPDAIISQEDGITFVTIAPEFETLYESDLERLTETLLATAESATPPLVLIDIPQIKFFGSAFLGMLLRASNRLRLREGGRLGLCRLTPYCRTVMDITKSDRLWDIFETREEAIAEFSNA